MKIQEMAEKLELTLMTSDEIDREVTGVYACDLLSRVISGCEAGDVWITVQTHLNVLAVAELNEAACIVVPEGIKIDAGTIEKALDKEIAVYSSGMSTYELCWKIHELTA